MTSKGKKGKQETKGTKRKFDSYESFIVKLKAQIHPSLGTKKSSLAVLDQLAKIIVKKIAVVSNSLVQSKDVMTLKAATIESAVKLSFHGGLVNQSVKEMNKALKKYKSTLGEDGKKISSVKSTVTISSGLIISVPRTKTLLKKYCSCERYSELAAIATAAVVESVLAEIVELAGRITLSDGRVRMTPKDINFGIKNDEELDMLFCNTAIGNGGYPARHQIKLEKAKKRKTKKKSN